MKPASFLLSLLVSAPLLLASTVALAAPKKKAPKATTSVSAKGPKKTDKAAAADKADPTDKADKADKPEPVAPETKAADAKSPEVAPTPILVGTTTSADKNADRDRHEDRPRDEQSDDTNKFQVAPLLGYGSNYLGLGLGVRAGYTLPNKVYVGGTFMYHVGASYGYYGYGYGVDSSYHVLYPAGEVGYNIHVGPVTIRPYAGVGVAFGTYSASYLGKDQSTTATALIVYPGATAYWNIPRSSFFVGGDTRIAILTNQDIGNGGAALSFGFFGTGGLKF